MAQIAFGLAFNTAYHPFAYAKTLIQLGHEPFPPKLSKSLFGKHVYMYPNVLKYVNHIYKLDGFTGLFRGLPGHLVYYVVGTIVSNDIKQNFADQKQKTELDEIDEDTTCGTVKKLVVETAHETIARCAGVICSYPFYVVYIRSMGQFVGRESLYSSFFGSIGEIWRSEGIVGFFGGLIPRLVGEVLTIWIANILTESFRCAICHINNESSEDFKVHYSLISQLIASTFTYPFNLISVIMSVNKSGLAVASPPITPYYNSWVDCWRHLSKQNQLKRGNGLFFRRYRGPTPLGGFLMPPLQDEGKYHFKY